MDRLNHLFVDNFIDGRMRRVLGAVGMVGLLWSAAAATEADSMFLSDAARVVIHKGGSVCPPGSFSQDILSTDGQIEMVIRYGCINATYSENDGMDVDTNPTITIENPTTHAVVAKREMFNFVYEGWFSSHISVPDNRYPESGACIVNIEFLDGNPRDISTACGA